MYPLITNDRGMSPVQTFQAHKGQPMIEKRFEQIKTVHEIAPVLLKNEGRIEALFTHYFLALLVQALIERELRLAMKREKIDELPLYPEQRNCARPTTEQILRLFSLAERHQLMQDGKVAQASTPTKTDPGMLKNNGPSKCAGHSTVRPLRSIPPPRPLDPSAVARSGGQGWPRLARPPEAWP
jgi:hypothetical protein